MIIRNGGDEENRTPDPLLARQMLSQLSYTPHMGFIVSRVLILGIFALFDELCFVFFPLSV